MNRRTTNPANTLGLDYRALAQQLPYRGPIWDVHTHLGDVESARLYFEIADQFNVQRTWSMSQLEDIDALRAAFGDRLEFIAVPNYFGKGPDTYTTDWLRRIEGFAEKGVKICKFWAAPRGRDFHEAALLIDSPQRRESMKLARSLGMMFMTHIADPDTWFATKYADASRYGTKNDQYTAFERMLDEFGDVPWLAAHMAGTPEDFDRLQGLLDRHPNLYIDTAATKWMVRELSKQPQRLREFLAANPGRVLFGSDIVTAAKDMSYDLYASRYWALRTLFETDYDGPSPIVDPDLNMVDPTQPADATAHLRGAALDDTLLQNVYHDAAATILPRRTD